MGYFRLYDSRAVEAYMLRQANHKLIQKIESRPRKNFYPRQTMANIPIGDSSIYFISDGDFIKIGKADDVKRRVHGIQTSSPRALSILASVFGPPELEKMIHQEYSEDRERGEWFRDTEELCQLVWFARHGMQEWIDWQFPYKVAESAVDCVEPDSAPPAVSYMPAYIERVIPDKLRVPIKRVVQIAIDRLAA